MAVLDPIDVSTEDFDGVASGEGEVSRIDAQTDERWVGCGSQFPQLVVCLYERIDMRVIAEFNAEFLAPLARGFKGLRHCRVVPRAVVAIASGRTAAADQVMSSQTTQDHGHAGELSELHIPNVGVDELGVGVYRSHLETVDTLCLGQQPDPR